MMQIADNAAMSNSGIEQTHVQVTGHSERTLVDSLWPLRLTHLAKPPPSTGSAPSS